MRKTLAIIALSLVFTVAVKAQTEYSNLIFRNDSVFGFNNTTKQFEFITKRMSVSAGQGYGGTVTQATNKSTGVTINKQFGQITTHAAALAAAAEVKFTVTNNQVSASDVPFVAIKSGGTSGSYLIAVSAVADGSFDITITNASAGSLSQAIVINFYIFKSVIN
jgi:hypothetical protein